MRRARGLEADEHGAHARLAPLPSSSDARSDPYVAQAPLATFGSLDVQRRATELMDRAHATGRFEIDHLVDDDAQLEVALVALRRGGGITESSAPHSAVLTPILGRVRFATGNGSTDLVAGRSMFIRRGSRHELLADDDAVIMLVSARSPRPGELRIAHE